MRSSNMRSASNRSDKLLWIVAGLAALMFVAAAMNKVLVNKVADRVILKLQKEYSPSPYGPGLDPDKINIDQIKPKQKAKPKPKQNITEEWDEEFRN